MRLHKPRRRLADLRALRDQIDAEIAREEIRVGLSDHRRAPDASEEAVDAVLHVLTAVSEAFLVPVEEIRGRGRSRSVAGARHVAMTLLHDRYGMSARELARIFDRADHTAVLYALLRVDGEPRLREALDQVARSLDDERAAS